MRPSPSPPHQRDPELAALILLLDLSGDPAARMPGSGFCVERVGLLATRHRVLIPAVAGWERLARAGRAAPVPPRLLQMARSERVLALQVAGWLGRLRAAFDEAGLDWLALKGPALSQQIYGDPGWRTARDLDVLVPGDQVARAVAVAETLGWQAPDAWQAVMNLTGKIDLELEASETSQPLLEIHNALGPAYAGLDFGAVRQIATATASIGGQRVPTLSTEDTIIYVAWHGAKHLWARMNWLLDLAGLLARGDYDPTKLIARARQVGAERSLRGGEILSRRLLRAPVPVFPAASASTQRAAERIAMWGEQRIALGPQPGAVGRRPWSYRWHLREARLSDQRLAVASRLRSLLAPVEPDVRWLGPHRRAALHYAARPFLLGRRILADAFGRGG